MIRQIKEFWRSRHRSAYKDLAIKYKVSPLKVYRLAHGGRASSNVDSDILDELLQRGIISGIRPY